MMWKTVVRDCNCSSSDPPELLILKRELASLECNCGRCVTNRTSPAWQHDSSYTPVPFQRDEEVQANPEKNLIGQFIQAMPNCFPSSLSPTAENSRKVTPICIHKNNFCPTCFFTLNLLRDGVAGVTRVLKDEEIETKADMFSCDKSTEKIVRSLEKTTSFTTKPVLKYSNSSLCDDLSETTSNTSAPNSDNPIRKSQKSSSREVTFLLNYQDEFDLKQIMPSCLPKRNCLFVDDLINSIRPPIPDDIWYE